MAKSINAVYFEGSAVTGEKVTTIFEFSSPVQLWNGRKGCVLVYKYSDAANLPLSKTLFREMIKFL